MSKREGIVKKESIRSTKSNESTGKIKISSWQAKIYSNEWPSKNVLAYAQLPSLNKDVEKWKCSLKVLVIYQVYYFVCWVKENKFYSILLVKQGFASYIMNKNAFKFQL